MKTLQEWLTWSRELEDIYHQELGRSAWGDPDAFVSWTWHRAQGRSAQWVREQIHNSSEARARQGVTETSTPSAELPPIAGIGVIPVAGAADGPWHPRFYSYWSNALIEGDGIAWVFAGSMRDNRPKFFHVDLATRHVEARELNMPYHGTTEGWSWDREGWIHLLEGPRLRRVNPFDGQDHVVLDISDSHPGCRLWQSHSEGGTHCATVERIVADGPYERIGTIVSRDGAPRFVPATGTLDESALSGDWLIIKETRERDGHQRLDNRLINLATGEDRWVLDEAGALGHSDGEAGVVVGEDDFSGACVSWDLRTGAKSMLFPSWNMGHVSLRNGHCIVSNDTEIVRVNIAAGGFTTLLQHGATVTDYDSQVRANLDPTGRVACYMANGAINLLVL